MRRLATVLLACAGCSSSSRSVPDAHVPICPAQAVLGYEVVPFTPDGGPIDPLDRDGDGWTTAAGDCDDTDPNVHPGAPEVCDLVDNDCNGQVDEGACPDVCPIDFPEEHCCDATHRIAGTFLEPASASWPILPGVPYAVLLRRRDTGETRAAGVCPAPNNPNETGRRFRFLLEDQNFIQPARQYEILIHLRWYFPEVLHELALCFHPAAVAQTNPETAAACVDAGGLVLGCF
jgi:hypothetical protein